MGAGNSDNVESLSVHISHCGAISSARHTSAKQAETGMQLISKFHSARRSGSFRFFSTKGPRLRLSVCANLRVKLQSCYTSPA